MSLRDLLPYIMSSTPVALEPARYGLVVPGAPVASGAQKRIVSIVFAWDRNIGKGVTEFGLPLISEAH